MVLGADKLSARQVWLKFLDFLRYRYPELYEKYSVYKDWSARELRDVDVFVEKVIVTPRGYDWCVYLEDEKKTFVYGRTLFGDYAFYETETMFVDGSSWQHVNLFWIDTGEPVFGEVPFHVLDELEDFGNRLVILAPIGGEIYRIKGGFFDELLLIELYDEIMDVPVFNWLNKYSRKIIDVVRKYYWEPIDAWRGYYKPVDKESDAFELAVRGWRDIAVLDENLAKLRDVLEMKTKFDYAIIVVFPHNTNLAIQYFDFWVEKGKAKHFVETLGLEDKFNYSEGINIELNP